VLSPEDNGAQQDGKGTTYSKRGTICESCRARSAITERSDGIEQQNGSILSPFTREAQTPASSGILALRPPHGSAGKGTESLNRQPYPP
jgi:hypothetical protein